MILLAQTNTFTTTSRIDAIQGLRALAALLVVVDHSITSMIEIGSLDPRNTSFAWMLGGMGVKIFFVISGFIMTITTHDDFASPTAGKKFLWKRLSRIAPLYWIITFIAAIKLAAVGRMPHMGALVASLLFIPWPNGTGELRPVLYVGWTLNYEMFFYLLFAAALHFRMFRGLAGLSVFLVILVVVNGVSHANGAATPDGSLLGFWGDSIVLYFVAGIAIGLARLRLDGSVARLHLGIHAALTGALLLVLSYAAYAFKYFSHDPASPWEVIACIGAVAVCAAATDHSDGKRPFICSLGDASYSIYLTHAFLVGLTMRIWAFIFAQRAPGLFVATMIVGCCILGMLTYRLLEKPLLSMIRNLGIMRARIA
jgi:peptidoglycan/LPS O-acetylase OafA/YrhL